MIVCPWKDILRYAPVMPGLEEAIEKIAALENLEPATYQLSNGNKFTVMSGTTKPTEGATFEAHKNYLDIQYIVKGQEVVGWAPLETVTPSDEYNPVKDVAHYTGYADFMRIGQGYCYVVYPEDAHMPTRYLEQPNEYTKIVVKLKVN